MDYGKLAYVKTEEIERMLRASSAGGENRTGAVASFHPRAALESGYEPCSVFGSGNVALTVSLTLRAPVGADNVTIKLYADGCAVAYTRVSATAGGTVGVTLLAAVYPPKEGAKISVKADKTGFLAEEMSVLAQGSGASVISGYAGIRSDYYDGEVYYAREEDGYLYITRRSDGKKVNAVHGSVFDIAASGGGIDVVCCDDDGNLWGIGYSGELDEKYRVNLGDAPEKIAIGAMYGEILLAAVRDRKLCFALAEQGFKGMTEWQEADFGAGSDEAYLSKQSKSSAVAIRRDGKLYAKLPVAYKRADGCVKVRLEVQVGIEVR